MADNKEEIIKNISDELADRFPGMKPKIAEIKEDRIIYELEQHGNYMYYSVKYRISAAGELNADWDNAELAVY
jgi:hypothetical protein